MIWTELLECLDEILLYTLCLSPSYHVLPLWEGISTSYLNINDILLIIIESSQLIIHYILPLLFVLFIGLLDLGILS